MTRSLRVAAATTALLSLAAILSWPRPPQNSGRAAAILRGLRFIYGTATDSGHFAEYGQDYVWAFYCIASTSADPELRWLADRMGRERAAQWRRDHKSLPPKAGPDEIASLTFGDYAAGCFGLKDDELKRQLQRAAAQMSPKDFLRFDPAHEPVPANIPKSGGGAMSRYDVMEDAIVAAYSGNRAGVVLGRPYADVVRWIPSLRPYPNYDRAHRDEHFAALYLVTHIVYTLNGYSTYRLRPEWLPQEYEFLKANLKYSIAENDPEAVGEFMDTLKSFGVENSDPLLRDGTAYLLSRQNPDGSWGNPKADDIYDRYHATWTAIDGLRDYAWRGEGVSYPEALELLLASGR